MKHPRYLLSGLALSMLIASGGAQAAGLSSEQKPFGKTNGDHLRRRAAVAVSAG
jgi:aldose 1-epimerase